jgi:hypothetical protein
VQLAGACEAHGLRSISDVTRAAVQEMLNKSRCAPINVENETLSRLTEAVSHLTHRLDMLVAALGACSQSPAAGEGLSTHQPTE